MKLPLIALLALVGCASAVPTPAQEARVGTYTAALEACDAQLAVEAKAAKATGAANRSELETRYQTCAHNVDVEWGRSK